MLTIIDYGYGNLRSVHKAIAKTCDIDIFVTNNPDLIAKSDRIVLPGVGAYKQCMDGLKSIDGMIEVIENKVLKKGTPFLGICVGMQLLANCGIEFETSDGLGWIDGKVTRLEPNDKTLKIPQMGWNEVTPLGNKVFENAWDNTPQDVYFVHSYAFRTSNNEDIAATCKYGDDTFAAAVAKDNIMGFQFHPEKSQKAGLKLLEAWLKL
jgi:glutamine amidotransferase